MWLFRALDTGETNVTPASFPDAVGYECFINHLHIRDHISEQTERLHADEQLVHGLRFALELQERLPRHQRFEIIVASNEDDCNVRFHGSRAGQSWVADDLEGYQEDAVLVVSNHDTGLSSLLFGLPA
jgi:hypothetical protein